MPFISIIVPVYDVEKYIVNTIRSLCVQTFRDYEIILVDDESPDRSVELAEAEFQKHTTPFKIIRQKNQGVAVARNTGIEAAKGDWVICVDSDDEIHPETLTILYNTIQAYSEVEVLGINLQERSISGVHEHLEISPSVGSLYTHDQIIGLFALSKIRLFAPGLLIKRKFLQDNGLTYRKDVRYSEDMFFVWQVLAKAKAFAYVNQKLYYYFKRPGSTMRASGKDKILTGYRAFQRLNETVGTQLGQWSTLISPRWVVGALHSAAKYMDFKEFTNLAKSMDYRKNSKKLLKFPQIKVVLLAIIMQISLHLFYFLMKKF